MNWYNQTHSQQPSFNKTYQEHNFTERRKSRPKLERRTAKKLCRQFHSAEVELVAEWFGLAGVVVTGVDADGASMENAC